MVLSMLWPPELGLFPQLAKWWSLKRTSVCAVDFLNSCCKCRLCYLLLILMHHLMFWTIPFWIWSTTWYCTEHVLFVNILLLFFLLTFNHFFLTLSVPSIFEISVAQMTAGWDRSISSCSLHPAKIASQENISPISPNSLALVDLCSEVLFLPLISFLCFYDRGVRCYWNLNKRSMAEQAIHM